MVTKTINVLREFSVPLIGGVVAALVCANTWPEWYETVVHAPLCGLFGDEPAHHHPCSLAFWVNDVLMVFFFGIAAKEITEACLPGGDLNPPRKAVNPLLATLGGVLGPIAVFAVANSVIGSQEFTKGWGIPTATDIALAWLVARMVFGAGHPAISFLLLLAVADDAIGLGIIAIAYPDPHHPTEWMQLLWMVPGLVCATIFRWRKMQAWLPYILFGGGFCWWGLYAAHLHPALALVPIVPFIPAGKHDAGLFTEAKGHEDDSPLEQFEHNIKLPVDFGLFFFGFANAGVTLTGVSNLTWIILISLILGKMVGITIFAWIGDACGAKLPEGITFRDLVVTGCIAGLGLTVALFVSNQAFADAGLQGAAKMGALLSVAAAPLAWLLRQRK